MSQNYVAISGSLREKSFNTSLLKAAQEVLPSEATIEILSIKDIPLYNQDLEANYPIVVQKIKDKIKNADGIIFATPEYNRSVPGVLKNVIDWVSRPYGTNAFAGKLVLLLGASPGAIGTAVAQSHLKEILLYLDMKVIGQPEFYLGGASQKFNEQGVLTDEVTKEHLRKILIELTLRS